MGRDGAPLRWSASNLGGELQWGASASCSGRGEGQLHDRALWTADRQGDLGATGNTSNALTGTAETVAQALLDYYDIGVTTFLIRGFDPYNDAIDFGRELIPGYGKRFAVAKGFTRHRSALLRPRLRI